MSGRVIRCAACSRRIKGSHPHIGIEDYGTGREIAYHAHSECQERAVKEMGAMLERGKLYILHHYHVCPDEAPGFHCSGGCFSGAVILGRN
jgi:Fe2+ or Zn2+ uptake regulation protein